ncbi:MAG: hypothetical protein EOL91_11315, partial [Actinobacteria bacterium]|nr:hypothetical protein [Actinomycetota bacterium]
MAVNRLDILLNVDDKATNHIRRFESQTKKSAANIKKDFVEMAIKATAFVYAIRAVANAASSFIEAASKVEQLRVRLTVLTGTLEKGNELFEKMADLAGRVPFTYDEIMAASVNLRAVVRGGNEEVVRLMPIILDLAATTGLGIEETTSQMIRMYSAGAGAADLFRERGVLAMLGFQAGVSVSAEETMDRVIAAWEDGESRFRGATEKLATTWQGQVSMMQDAWFNFKVEIGETFTTNPAVIGFMEMLTNKINEITGAIKILKGERTEEEAQLASLMFTYEKLNEMLERQQEVLGSPFLLNRNLAEEVHNTLLQQKSDTMLEILDLQRQMKESAPEESADNIDKAQEEAEETIAIEANKLNFLGQLHKNFNEKVQSYEDATAEVKLKNQRDVENQVVKGLSLVGDKMKAAALIVKAIKMKENIMETASGVSKALGSYPPP